MLTDGASLVDDAGLPPPNDSGLPNPSDAGAMNPTDPELAAIVDAWPGLPDAIRAGIVAMVRAAGGAGR